MSAADPARTLACLRRGIRRGGRLALSADAVSSASIRAWVSGQPVLRELSGMPSEWLVSALFEACVNIAEHGYGNRPEGRIDVWWLPGRPRHVTHDDPRRRAGRGMFVVRDRATPYAPRPWRARDFGDAAVRRHGRGIGFDILHRVMQVVAYHAATEHGNLTLLRFDPDAARREAGESAA